MTYRSVSQNCNNWRHGFSKSATYASWNQMLQRVNNPNRINYAAYGGRGIRVCERWLKFENFLADMGERPKGHTIERIDNDGNYCPENCKWATDAEQRRNQKRNHKLTFQGETLCLADWGTRYGLTGRAIYKRLVRGWSIEDAITKPLRVTRLTHKSP